MAEDTKKNGNGNGNSHVDGCMCMGCRGGMMGPGGMGYGRRGGWTFFLLRTLLTILILMIVFWFGVQVGRMSSRGFGYGGARGVMMMRGGSGGGYPITGYNPGGPMIPATSTAAM